LDRDQHPFPQERKLHLLLADGVSAAGSTRLITRLQGQVRWLAFRKDVVSFLHAFAFATCAEGFGQVVVKVIAVGKPVVTGKVPRLPEIDVDETTAGRNDD
jgi:glycosyltransferase involved in cell wall biosynthesis